MDHFKNKTQLYVGNYRVMVICEDLAVYFLHQVFQIDVSPPTPCQMSVKIQITCITPHFIFSEYLLKHSDPKLPYR